MRREQPQAPGSAAEVRDMGLLACRASDAFLAGSAAARAELTSSCLHRRQTRVWVSSVSSGTGRVGI